MNADRSYAKSNVISANLKGYRTSLDEINKSTYGIPVSLFRTKNSNIYNDIENAIEYLKVVKDGAVRVPANSDENHYNAVLISSSIDRKTYDTKINYSTTNYSHPTVSPRPYTNDNWEIGDIVYNNDFTTNSCTGWVCIESGTPGEWLQFGYAKNWSSTAEEVDEIPEACKTQLGRIITHNGAIYCCVVRDEVYYWNKLNISLYGNRDQRPNQPNELYPGLTYFNTDTGLPEFWDGTKWSNFTSLNQNDRDRLSKLEDGLSKLSENYDTYIKGNNQSLDNINNALSTISDNLSKLATDFTDYKSSNGQSLGDINNSINSIKDDTTSLHNDINDINDSIKSVNDDITDIKTDTSSLHDDISNINTSIKSMSDEISTIKEDTSSLQNDIDSIDGKIDKVPSDVVDSIISNNYTPTTT